MAPSRYICQVIDFRATTDLAEHRAPNPKPETRKSTNSRDLAMREFAAKSERDVSLSEQRLQQVPDPKP